MQIYCRGTTNALIGTENNFSICSNISWFSLCLKPLSCGCLSKLDLLIRVTANAKNYFPNEEELNWLPHEVCRTCSAIVLVSTPSSMFSCLSCTSALSLAPTSVSVLCCYTKLCSSRFVEFSLLIFQNVSCENIVMFLLLLCCYWLYSIGRTICVQEVYISRY
jgi:hypothetical protein